MNRVRAIVNDRRSETGHVSEDVLFCHPYKALLMKMTKLGYIILEKQQEGKGALKVRRMPHVHEYLSLFVRLLVLTVNKADF